MRYYKFLLFILIIVLSSNYTFSQNLEEAQSLYEQGKYNQAISLLDSITTANSKDTDALIQLSSYLYETGQKDKALKHLEAAKKAGNSRAMLMLIEYALNDYNLEDADIQIKSFKSSQKRATEYKSEIETLQKHINKIKNMLERVEEIVVIDSLIVDKTTFLEYYKLPDSAGFLIPSNEDSIKSIPNGIAYLTEDMRKKIWSTVVEGGSQFYTAERLLDDLWEEPVSLGENLFSTAILNYPFLLSDGLTLYYAENGDNSIGGYDIFVSRNNGREFLEAQNVGMPFNSPYNDYMLAIDEVNGIGWWASERNQMPDKVTIYIFLPSQMRVNVSDEDPLLRQKALLKSIKLTQNSESDYSQYISLISDITPNKIYSVPCIFEISMPDGTIKRSKNDFKSERAQEILESYIELQNRMNSTDAQLEKYRAQYGSGKKTLAEKILNLEKQIQSQRIELQRLTNEIVKAELQK